MVLSDAIVTGMWGWSSLKALRDRVHLVFSVECEGGNAVVSHFDEVRLMLFFRSLKADFVTVATEGMVF